MSSGLLHTIIFGWLLIGSSQVFGRDDMTSTIHLTAKLPVSQSLAFDLFTQDAHLTKWLAEEAHVEVKLGGRYELFWDPQHPEENSTIGCHISALSPNNLIMFDWKGPTQFAKFMNTADPLTYVVATFSPCVSEGECTEVNLIHAGWHTGADWAAARAWQERAWLEAFKQLKVYALVVKN